MPESHCSESVSATRSWDERSACPPTRWCSVTAQNHGFALGGEAGQSFDTPFGHAVVSHTCANDGVVEGVKLADGKAFSVQYHPEAAAGPHDAEYLFDQFVDLMAGGRR